MKQIVENNQSQQRITIQVKTLPNGYSLDLEKENFMYYSPMALLEGLFVHVGMNREGAMTKESVKNGGIVTKLQAEVNALNDTIAELRKQVREQKKVIKELSKEV